MRALAATAGVIWLAASLPARALELHDVRVLESSEGTRVVLDLDGAVEPHLQTLSDPDRVVLDLPATSRASQVGSWIEGRGVVQRVRTGEHGAALRVVLDLAVPATVKSFPLADAGGGYRFAIDLSTPQAVTPRSEAAPQPATAPVTQAVRAEPQAPAKVAQRSKPIVIAIDAGHGGEDPGAEGRRGTQEKQVTLAIARDLARLTDAEPGYKAVLVRNGDYFIPLRGRIDKARAAQADLFVSIHCNASPNREAQGSAVYVLSARGASNEHSRWLANKENSADLIGGIELQDKDDTLAAVLFDISQTSAMEASIDVGGRVLGALSDVNDLLKPDVQQAGFVVLKSPDIPSILVETAFISNPKEERMLRSATYQRKMAASILAGIKGYFQTYRPQATQIVAEAAPAQPVEGKLVDVSLRKPARTGKPARRRATR